MYHCCDHILGVEEFSIACVSSGFYIQLKWLKIHQVQQKFQSFFSIISELRPSTSIKLHCDQLDSVTPQTFNYTFCT